MPSERLLTSTGSGLPSWAPRMAARVPTEDCSDSDDDGSELGDEKGVFSPVSKSLLATVCIFGADGNLASKKILPTLFQLWKQRLMPRDMLIFGYARAEMTTEAFRKQVFRCIYNPTQPQNERKEFLQRVHYVQGQFDDQSAIRRLLDLMNGEEAKRHAARWDAKAASPKLVGMNGPVADAERSPNEKRLMEQVRI